MSKSILRMIGIGIYNLIFGLLISYLGAFLIGRGLEDTYGYFALLFIYFSLLASPFVLWLWEIALYGWWGKLSYGLWHKRTVAYFVLCLVLFSLPFWLTFFICQACIVTKFFAPFAIAAVSGLMMLAAQPIVWLKQKET